MYDFLCRHPFVHSADAKEINFFNKRYHKGENWYRSWFPLSIRRKIAKIGGRHWQTGEASPDYLVESQTAERCHECVPDVKLIVLLRNPVDRAYSHWRMTTRRNVESLPFHEAVFKDPTTRSTSSDVFTPIERYGYLHRGEYACRLEAWLSLFDRTQFSFIQSERFRSNPKETLRGVFSFLGLPEYELQSYSPTYTSPPAEPMSPEVRRRLVEYFNPHNRRLFDLIGRKFEEWNA
jgi:hypothetical protein